MAIDLHPDVVAAIRDLSNTPLGRKYNRMTQKRYGVEGWRLAGKTVAGEFGGRSTRTGRGVVSSAGARGPAQFIPSTRAAYIQQHNVDPWKNDRQAIKGMMLHHLSTGVEGYNPGMPTYKDYILGQKLNAEDRGALRSSTKPNRSAGNGTLALPGRRDTHVHSDVQTIPGQSFEAERGAARQDLLLSGDINLKSLLQYKSKVNSLQDIPARKVRGPLQVERSQRPDVKVATAVKGGLPTGAKNIENRKWGGSKFAGRSLVKAAGLPVVSKKRSTQHTASGGVSDHYDQNKDSFAWDLGVTGETGTRVARKLARMLGEDDWQGGSWLNVTKTIGGVKYRFQLGWNVPDHHDHIHLGVDRVDIPG